MAGGMNKKFRKNPTNFLREYVILKSPDDPVGIPAGVVDIDLVPVGRYDRDKVRIERFNARTHGWGAKPIHAYWLPAQRDNSATIPIAGAADYMFTCDLSGCLFAAYGANNAALTVEHVNVHSAAAAVPIVPRARAILASGPAGAIPAFCKILSPAPIPPPAGLPPAAAAVAAAEINRHVIHYPGNAWVIGVRHAGWRFYCVLSGSPHTVRYL